MPDDKGRFSILKSASQKMEKLNFPSLQRPDGNSESPATPELIDWGIRVFVFSLLSHFRELLRSFLFLATNGYVLASFIVCRAMYEMAAQAYYVNKHIDQYLKSDDLEKAWSLFIDVQTGSRYMQEFGGEPDCDIPPHIKKVMNCFNEYLGDKTATKTYSFLSEHTHPSTFTSVRHYGISLDTKSIVFGKPPRNSSEAPLNNAIASTMTVMLFVNSLLLRTGENEVAHQLREWLEEFVRLHKGDQPCR